MYLDSNKNTGQIHFIIAMHLIVQFLYLMIAINFVTELMDLHACIASRFLQDGVDEHVHSLLERLQCFKEQQIQIKELNIP